MTCCRLRSRSKDIPDQLLYEGRSLTIGRNRICRIKALNCSKNMFKATLKSGSNKELILENLRNGQSSHLIKSDIIRGPGFEYEVDFVDEKTPIIWSELFGGDLLKAEYKGGSDRSKAKVAAFDLDGTIIVTKSGKKFPQDAHDWRLFDNNLPKALSRLSNQYGYRFVIITNQMGIANKSTKVEDIKLKIENILDKLDLPCTVFIAPNDNRFRKPNIGVWEYISQESCDNSSIDQKSCFFVGDAAGRKKTDKKGQNDHSAADILFAHNCKIKFFTPEKFLQRINNGTTFDLTDELKSLMSNIKIFNSQNFIQESSSKNALLVDFFTKNPFSLDELPSESHCILFSGIPATGKSSFFKNYLQKLGYDYVNRDELKTMQKCLSSTKESLKKGRKCVIDNTNTSTTQRSQFIQLAKEFNCKIFAIIFELPIEHIFHNLKYRKLIDNNHQDVQKVAVYTARKHYENLNLNEGFDRIFVANFIPVFENENYKNLYSRFLLDK